VEFRFVYGAESFEETVAFWAVDMGLERVAGWDRAPDDRGAIFAFASGLVEVLARSASRPGLTGCGGVSLLVEVDDVDAWFRRLEEVGAPLTAAPRDRPWGHRDISVSDPNGLRVTLFQKTGGG
jgi:catechol 2,3-dioxygenase-like lactoylglutathione lyase family enzyme